MDQYKARIKIVCGRGLCVRDTMGKSDPYVEVIRQKNVVYKTAVKKFSLNPNWNEQFDVKLNTDSDDELLFKVYDHDVSSSDDFMGQAKLDVFKIELNESVEFKLELSDETEAKLGYIVVRVVKEKVEQEKSIQVENFLQEVFARNSKGPSCYIGQVRIFLLQTEGLTDRQDIPARLSSSVILGKQEVKHRKVGSTPSPTLIQPIYLDWFQGQDNMLEISLFVPKTELKSKVMVGRTFLNLKNLTQEKTHNMWLPLEETESGKLNVLVTVSDTGNSTPPTSDISVNPDDKKIGKLLIKEVEVDGLQPRTFGTRKPYVVIELVNQRVKTRAKEGTNSLSWNQEFYFDVRDIHTEVNFTVCEDGDTGTVVLGRVLIPLTQLLGHTRQWVALKNQCLRGQAKGINPRILLDITLNCNYLKAASKMFHPKEVKYEMQHEAKFKVCTLNLHLKRLIRIQSRMTPPDPAKIMKEIENILSWETPVKTSGILLGLVLVIWFLELYMIPLCLMIPFFINLFKPRNSLESEICLTNNVDVEVEEAKAAEVDETEATEIIHLQKKKLVIQEFLGQVAHAVESFENVFNFSDPIVSSMVLLLLVISTIAVYLIPFRMILILFTLKVFTCKLYCRLPNSMLNNFMSRLNDKEQMKNYTLLNTNNTSGSVDNTTHSLGGVWRGA